MPAPRSIECQRERLWRALLRREEPEMDFPWYECDRAGSKTLEQIIGVRSDTDVSSHRESRRIGDTAARTRELDEQNREQSDRRREQSNREREKPAG